jgi:NAD(P)-dependent dehydrogenase (short-subunit alcohol dehydrogenase family)
MSGPYRGKTAVVVGGTHGMGLAMVRALYAGGASVLLTGRNEQNVARTRAELGPAVHVVRSDVASLRDIQALAAQVEAQLGQIDALFLNVGVAELAPFERVDEAAYDRQFDINTKGVFFTMQKLVPLVRDGGALVLTTVTPATGTPTMAVYTGTKGALRGFVKVFAAELLARQVRVNAVAPGFIDTPTLGIASASAEERAQLKAMGDVITPMRRHGSAEEVARAALFLAFDATFTTGAELPVDGGLSQVEASR